MKNEIFAIISLGILVMISIVLVPYVFESYTIDAAFGFLTLLVFAGVALTEYGFRKEKHETS